MNEKQEYKKPRLFRPGETVEVIKTPSGADQYTPRAGTICIVTATDYRRGNRHPVHVTALSDKTLEDWFPVDCLAPAWWWRQKTTRRRTAFDSSEAPLRRNLRTDAGPVRGEMQEGSPGEKEAEQT